ncbi:MAG: molybdopterin-dependent oxidoreductase [Burkholderiaceae bacterium]|nr:molybdopterin-dependent oxidoreductase [Burkholderiaceae bacterium]
MAGAACTTIPIAPAAGTVRTTCPYCGVGCGVIVAPSPEGGFEVRGDPAHPANRGRLCSKGSALAQTLGPEDRLRFPEIGNRRAGWDEALELVAQRFTATIDAHGPDSVAFYVSGQLLTEDYYVANKLMKGFVGSANIDTNSRLCMASTVAGHRRAFGADIVPGCYDDLEQADLVVLVGSNLAWCHPVLYQRIVAAMQARPQMRLVVIDPRRTMSAERANLHLAVRPDGDVALFNGLLAHLAATDTLDRAYIDAHTRGFEAALAAARERPRAQTAELTGLSEAELACFYTMFACTDRVVTIFSQGVNQSRHGTDKVNAIINCHLATGRIGRPGMGPFSVTGQPNAMGGREVGGLANMLAAHLDIDEPADRDRLQRFWRSPRMAVRAGLKALDLFEAIEAGRIRALWVLATNPVDSLPEADRVRRAIAACPFVVVSDVVAHNDTLPLAHVRLPSLAWGEKDGTVTNSERRISRQRAFMAAPALARADWWQLAEVARRMGFGPAFEYDGPAAIFAEHARLSDFENDGRRAFDIGAHADIDAVGYARLEPFQWPQGRGQAAVDRRFFANGGFQSADRKGRFLPVRTLDAATPDTEYSLTLNTGRVRDHWHTMTRTGRSPRLSAHIAEPFVEIHPDDARVAGIDDADIVRVESGHGQVLLRALITARQRAGSVFAPMHWNDQFASMARIGALIPSERDPVSGQPASKQTFVRITRCTMASFIFAVSRTRPRAIEAAYWSVAACDGGWRIEAALERVPSDWPGFARRLLGTTDDQPLAIYRDDVGGGFRAAASGDGRLAGALFAAPTPVAVARNWLVDRLREPAPSAPLATLLAGGPGDTGEDAGATVCACTGVGAATIAREIERGCASVDEIGRCTGAGTQCGSCRSEIGAMLAAAAPQPLAA